ncbi:MAG: hypothetical protein JNG85_16070 [Spirochaetaceae bacterium]|nr:hypothetical protein [Spirochaetaceae bacterium]
MSLLDDSGVPLVFRLPAEDLYGIAPERYAARVAELSALLRSDEASRGAGIVRSLHGAAVHRPVRKGDRFSIWIEQTGGLTIKDAFVF